jgi:hypothetical protein
MGGLGWWFHEDVRFALYGGYTMIRFQDGYSDTITVGVKLDYLFQTRRNSGQLAPSNRLL